MNSDPQTVKTNQVVQLLSGRKYVANIDHPLPEGAKIIADQPHADGDYSYVCGFNHCRCMQ